MVENIDKDPKKEYQLLSSNEECRYCKNPIHIQASVCHHCGRHQKWYLNYFRIDHIGLFITAALFILACFQFSVARHERSEASKALKKASHAEDMVSKLENLVKQAQSIVDFNFLLTKANSDDRGAFDRLVKIAQESGPFQDLANKAKTRIISLPETLPQNTSIVNKLKEYGYTELLRYYHESPCRMSEYMIKKPVKLFRFC